MSRLPLLDSVPNRLNLISPRWEKEEKLAVRALVERFGQTSLLALRSVGSICFLTLWKVWVMRSFWVTLVAVRDTHSIQTTGIGRIVATGALKKPVRSRLDLAHLGLGPFCGIAGSMEAPSAPAAWDMVPAPIHFLCIGHSFRHSC